MKRLYYNGPIITMDPAGGPGRAALNAKRAITEKSWTNALPEALLTENGHILAVGSMQDLRGLAAPEVEMVDLAGHTLMPAFIDSHSHFAAAANSFLQCDVSGAKSFAELKERLSAFAAEVPEGQWVRAQGYDQNLLAEGRHPDKQLLDAACPAHPVMLVHQSAHMGVFNTRALRRLGAESASGYLEEKDFLALQAKVPMPALTEMTAAFLKAQRWYASQGIATVQEGMFVGQLCPFYQALLASDQLKLDVVAYLDPHTASEVRAKFPQADQVYDGHFKIGGYKIFLDGSPQGRTAWLREPYEGRLPGEPQGYAGYPALAEEELEAALQKSAEDAMPLLAHCNGDAACLQLIDAVERVKEVYPELPDSVMIHAQLLPAEEMSRMKALGIIPSFFIGHVYYWGEAHVKNLGLSRAEKLSPLRSAAEAGLAFTLHQDTPVTAPNMLESIWCAAVRQTAEGRVLGPEECISVYEALEAVTMHAAAQYGEQAEKGSLTPGRRADMVIVDQNPLQVAAQDIRNVKVLATIKDGQPIYEA